MNDKSIWLSHIFYTGWKGFLKIILCIMLTQIFMIPGVMIVGLPIIFLKSMGVVLGQNIEPATLFVAMVLSLPFAFHYASRILKIQT